VLDPFSRDLKNHLSSIRIEPNKNRQVCPLNAYNCENLLHHLALVIVTWNNRSNPRRPIGAAGNRLFV
jgi:hypothetical protein